MTVVYDGGVQAGDAQSPHGDVVFRLPGRFEYVEVIVDADGYCSFDGSVRLGFRPHVGGRGIWIGLSACTPDGP